MNLEKKNKNLVSLCSILLIYCPFSFFNITDNLLSVNNGSKYNKRANVRYLKRY